MTDRALNYTLWCEFLATLGAIEADHIVTRPYRPQANGKVKRCNRTMLEEWAYVRLYRAKRWARR